MILFFVLFGLLVLLSLPYLGQALHHLFAHAIDHCLDHLEHHFREPDFAIIWTLAVLIYVLVVLFFVSIILGLYWVAGDAAIGLLILRKLFYFLSYGDH